jgi:hypothetical protein
MRFVKVAGAIALFASFCLAAVSGTVTNSAGGAAISGATVQLLHNGVSATTSSTGTFSLLGSTSINDLGSWAITADVPVLSPQGNEIHLNLRNPSKVTIKTYSVGGKQIGSVEKTYNAGSHSIMPARTNSGIYLYQVIVNGQAYTLKQANVHGNAAYALHQTNVSGEAQNPIAKIAAAAPIWPDTLLVYQPGFGTVKPAVSSSNTTGMNIQLTADPTSCTFRMSDYTNWTDPNAPYYIIKNNTWNDACRSSFTQSLYACSYHYWYVLVTMQNNCGGSGAVKSYPNVQKPYNPAVNFGDFKTLKCRFSESNPHTSGDIFNVSLDVWTNGVSADGCTEFMIWNDNQSQMPAGTQQTNVTVDGRTYTPWVRKMQPGVSGWNGHG